MKLLTLLLLIAHGICNVNAQIPAQDQEVKFATIAIPGTPSPTAASLGQYANYVVSNFTGTPAISIPLYEINEGGFKLPLSLSYNPSGIKVSDVASWVGLGWSLNCGGIITRNVRDIADDRGAFESGWLKSNYIVPASSIENSQSASTAVVGYSPEAGQKNALGLYQLRAPGTVTDTEPDIFYFNFNGHVGKFFFNQGSDTLKHTGQIPANQHTINLIPYQDLKFNYTIVDPLTGTGGILGSFTVVDENGNTYYFDKREVTSEYAGMSGFPVPSIVGDYNGGYDNTTAYTSSWYLSKIITVKNKEIDFNYVSESYNQRFPTTYSVRNFQPTTSGGKISNIDCSKAYDYLNANYSLHRNRVDGLRLASIESDDLKVVFDAEEARQDLTSAFALTAITVYSKNSVGTLSFVKKVKLNYSYLQSPVDPNLDNHTDYGDPYKRLRLDKVTELNEAGNQLNPYVLEYDNTYTLPGKLSPHQDFWGYFNNNTCNTLTPTVYIYPEEYGNERFSMFRKLNYQGKEFIINGADRNTNAAAALAGTLKKITFPLGGYEEFNFGSNVFYYGGQNIQGGGLRLEKSTRYDGISHLHDIIHEYIYNRTNNPQQSSGVLFNLPVFTYTENFLPYWNPSNPSQVFPRSNGEFDSEDFIYYTYNLVITSAPNYTLSGYDGVNVGYSEVTEHTPGNGYVVSQYSTPGRALASDDNPGSGCDPTIDGYCDGYFKVAPVFDYFTTSNCPNGTFDPNWSIDHTGLEFTSDGYPFAPKTNYDWNRGLLMSRKYFSEQNKLISETKNEYTVYTPKKKWPLYIYGLRRARMTNYKPYTSNCWATYGLIRFDVVAQYPIITNIAKVLSKTTTKTYNSLNTNGIESITEYRYNGNQLQNSEIIRTTGTNEKIDSRYFYPMDYDLDDNILGTDNLTNGILNLRKKHIVTPTIQSYVEVQDVTGANTKIIGGKFVEFRPDIPFPKASYEIETLSPINGSGQITVTNNVISRPSIYKSKVVFNFSPNGLLLQKQADNSRAESYQWGYNGQYIIAKASNTKYNNMFFDGFEEGNGNSVVNDSKTGDYSHLNAYSKVLTGLDAGSYILTYWQKASNIWSFIKTPITVSNSTYTISLNAQIDDVCFYPVNGQITTYTYNPLVGMTSTTDVKGEMTTYEYDDFKRLMNIKNKDGNLVKHMDYHYKSQ